MDGDTSPRWWKDQAQESAVTADEGNMRAFPYGLTATLCRLFGRLGIVLGFLVVVSIGCSDPRRQTQTVVKVGESTVVVRYEDGRLAEVLNDMNYDLIPNQEVKVVENCDGHLHVVAAYARD